MPFPGSAYSGALRNYSQFAHVLKHRRTVQAQLRFAEVHKQPNKPGMYQDISPPSHPGTCGSGTQGTQPSISHVDTTSHCLVILALTLARAEDLSAHLTPEEPDIDALSWYYKVLPQEQPAP